ncbi:uncharacterized protein LOC131070880 [Cryptomeria japonica]|uniref:uncharacterized protein LOC131070880 n=1 Tax=Cryptomeria japonica TaxID=3369 RepID=UPI0025ABB761|nr:uncharacterized protein LOC131070880 [Cryptomeria japonica]
MGYEKYNIGLDEDLKFVNIGNNCTLDERDQFIQLLRQYPDVLGYSYDDLKYFQPKEVQHDIPLKLGAVPFRQKQRQYNPKISSTILSEIQKMLDARIIFPIHHSTWLENIVPRFIPDFAEKTRHIMDMMKGKTIFLPDTSDTSVKSILTQQEFGMKRENWNAKIQEYDLEIRPTKLVRGRGLCQLIAEGILEEQELDDFEDLSKVLFVNTIDEWYSNIAFFLTYGECPQHLSLKEKRSIKLKAANFVLWDTGLYKRAIDGTFLRCVDKSQQTKLLESFHDKACGGHFSAPAIAHKILRAKYYWPTLFQDAFKWVQKCIHCQQLVGKQKLVVLPLKPVIVEEPFRQWGIDFIGVINPSSSAGHSYVLTAIDYFTKWVEAIPVKNATSEIVCRFLEENIISRFGVPNKIVTDNATTFSSSEITQFCFEYSVLLAHSFDYYPQGNGQAESSNKNLITIIHKLVEENQRSWHKALYDALWADKITPKRAIGMADFDYRGMKEKIKKSFVHVHCIEDIWVDLRTEMEVLKMDYCRLTVEQVIDLNLVDISQGMIDNGDVLDP